MSLAEQVIAALGKGEAATEKKILDGEWVDRAVGSLRHYSAVRAPSTEAAKAGAEVAKVLEINREELALGTSAEFANVTSLLHLELEGEARSAFLRSRATLAQRLEAMDEDSEATRAAVASDEVAWERWKAIGKKVLEVGGKFAVTMLFAL